MLNHDLRTLCGTIVDRVKLVPSVLVDHHLANYSEVKMTKEGSSVGGGGGGGEVNSKWDMAVGVVVRTHQS